MVKYYEVEGRLVKLENDEVTPVFHCYISVDNYYFIEEDGIFDGKEVHKGDVVIMLYDIEDEKRLYIILNEDNVITDKIMSIKERSVQRENNEVSGKCDCKCADPA